MALKIERELPNGVVVSYHRVRSITSVFPADQDAYTVVEVEEYVDAVRRNKKQQPVRIVQLTLPVGNIGSVREAIYRELSSPPSMVETTVPGYAPGETQTVLTPSRELLGYEGAEEL
jgi:hypothetical protein